MRLLRRGGLKTSSPNPKKARMFSRCWCDRRDLNPCYQLSPTMSWRADVLDQAGRLSHKTDSSFPADISVIRSGGPPSASPGRGSNFHRCGAPCRSWASGPITGIPPRLRRMPNRGDLRVGRCGPFQSLHQIRRRHGTTKYRSSKPEVEKCESP